MDKLVLKFGRTGVECEGQLSFLCESCAGERVTKSEDTPWEACRDCNGTGLDADALCTGASLLAWANSPRRSTPRLL